MHREEATSESAVLTGVGCDEVAILFPLDYLYRRCGMQPPLARVIERDALRQPYRALLAQEAPMTPRLERFFGGRLLLRPLSTLTEEGWYYRRVLLVQGSGRAVELAGVRIQLQGFSEAVREQIRACTVPLGSLLRSNDIAFESRPKFFLSIRPNAEMMGVFSMEESTELYGRRAELFRAGAKVGDLIEILPHLADRGTLSSVCSADAAGGPRAE